MVVNKSRAAHASYIRWIDFGVFAAAEASADGKGKKCPDWGRAMAVMAYPHSRVQIDACGDDHGVWLDRGEFDKIVKASTT